MCMCRIESSRLNPMRAEGGGGGVPRLSVAFVTEMVDN